VFGAGGDRDKGKRPMMGEAANRLSDVVIVTSDNPRTENPVEIIKEIMVGIDDKSKTIVIEDRKEAINHAIKIAEKDDIIFIAGKGHEEYQIIGETKFPFSDQKVVRDAIKNLK
jgi:UDP-N-acetylmuramoyl-L-alanyl-D-glutamate--2,6-diaminopimelate ligase